MMTRQFQKELELLFPFVTLAGKKFITEFYDACRYIELPAQVSICEEGEQCAQLALLLDGVGRVYKLSPGGREVTLYRVESGEGCVLTASCIMNDEGFPAMAVSETPIRAVAVPAHKVKSWICLDTQWQQ